MAYVCSYCKTGVMPTLKQYLIHIDGHKHKKRTFLIGAPNDGIEYDIFKTNKPFKSETSYVEKMEDFSDLSTNLNNFENEQVSLKDDMDSNSTNRPIIFYESPESPINNELDDDLFFKSDSKVESAKDIVDSYMNYEKTAAQALSEIATAMVWNLDFEPVSVTNFRYEMAVLIDGFEFAIGEGNNEQEAKKDASVEAISIIKMKLRNYEYRTPVIDKRLKKQSPVSKELIPDSYEKQTSYSESVEDFPDLSTNFNSFLNELRSLKYDVKSIYNSKNLPTVINEESPITIELDDYENLTLNFSFKSDSNVESQKIIVNRYIKNQNTATKALNDIDNFEPISTINLPCGLTVIIDGLTFTIGGGDNGKEIKQKKPKQATNAIKIKVIDKIFKIVLEINHFL